MKFKPTSLFTGLLLVCGLVQAQAYRCQVNGAMAYQQVPCAGGIALALPASPAPASAPQRPTPKAPAPAAPAVEVVVVTVPAPTGQRTAIQLEADACLDWYRPMLRDPRSAYWRDARYVQSTLEITIAAANGFGGFVNQEAACDFRNGSIDHGWTKTQAKRRAWAAN